MGSGEAHTNLPADLEMEHANRAAQLDIEAAKGWCFDSQIAVMYTKLTVSIREHLGEGDPEGGSHQAPEEGVGGATDVQILRKVVHNKSYSTLALHLRVLP